MTSRAGQLIASPTWGAARERRERRTRADGPLRFALGRSAASDAAAAALVLGASVALWAAFLLAVW